MSVKTWNVCLTNVKLSCTFVVCSVDVVPLEYMSNTNSRTSVQSHLHGQQHTHSSSRFSHNTCSVRSSTNGCVLGGRSLLQIRPCCACSLVAWSASSLCELSPFEDQLDKYIKVPLPVDVVAEFFGAAAQPRHLNPVFGRVAASVRSNSGQVSASTLSSYRSSLRWLYREHSITWNGKTSQRVGDVVEGYERFVTNQNQKGLMKIQEGKQPITFTGYQMLALEFLKVFPQAGPSVMNHEVTTTVSRIQQCSLVCFVGVSW